jgi:hypothetical protein
MPREIHQVARCGQHVLTAPRDFATGIGQYHLAGPPLDQGYAKVTLEVANLHRQRRLGDGAGIGGAPEMAVFGQR